MAILIHPLQSHHRLDMVRMREHIDCSDIGNSILGSRHGRIDMGITIMFRAWAFDSHVPTFPHENLEVTNECSRIARDVDNLSSTEWEKTREGRWMHPVSWWIDHDSICPSSIFQEFFCEDLGFFTYEFDICDTISDRIFYTILTGIRHHLNGVDFCKIWC